MLADRLAAVERSSRGQVLLVSGEAGIGKTSLVRRFRDAPGRPARVLWGACDPLFTPSPLGPLLAVAEGTGGELRAVVERGAMPYEVVAALAHELSARAPAVFVLEDVHWADEATLDVLRLLARRVETVPALVVASYRDDGLDRAHPLRIMLGELARSPTVGRLQLVRLSPEAVAQLAEPHGVDPGELYRKTAGNPFFVVEALAAGAATVPDTVRDAVLARAARLSPAGARLLEAVAVVPPQAEPWLLEALAGDAAGRLDECLTSGMLVPEAAGVAFRHELARLAVEESVPPHRKLELHRLALAALAGPPGGAAPDLARLAHHAEAAGDAGAVLRLAPAAAARAASLGAYREAAAQYGRALRSGGPLPAGQRAELLERRSSACHLTDQNDAAIAAIEEALACRRQLGQRLQEGDSLRWLSQILWCPGRTAEAERAAREAVTLLETLAPGRELAMAYANLAQTCAAAARVEEAVGWAGRALELAERLGDLEIAIHARATIGICQPEPRAAREQLERVLELALGAGLDEQVGRNYILLVGSTVRSRNHDLASRHLKAGIDYCSERGLERDRLYLLAHRAIQELDQGRWDEAGRTAAAVLRVPRTSITPRILALVVLGLVRARRGDPGQWAPLDEALGAGRADPGAAAGGAGGGGQRRGGLAGRRPRRRRRGDRERPPARPRAAVGVGRRGAGPLAPARRPRRRGPGRRGRAVRPPARRRVGAGGRALARAGLPLRGRARPGRRRPGGAAAAGPGRAAAAGGAGGRRPGRPAAAGARRAAAAAPPPAGHRGQPGRAHRQGARGARPARGRPAQRRDRRPPAHRREDRRPSRLGHPGQARRPVTARGRPVRGREDRERAARR